MSRILLVLAIVVVVYLFFKSKRAKSQTHTIQNPVENMVKCAACELNIPKSESLQVGTYFFCSAEHRDAYKG